MAKNIATSLFWTLSSTMTDFDTDFEGRSIRYWPNTSTKEKKNSPNPHYINVLVFQSLAAAEIQRVPLSCKMTDFDTDFDGWSIRHWPNPLTKAKTHNFYNLFT